jgi:two-component system chemotaxis response regulator CheB
MTRVVRVGIADDSQTIVDLLSGLVRSTPGLELVGTARDGVEAVQLAKHRHPDVLTMDVMMPRLDGLGATAAIMADAPTRVLMVCAVSQAEQTSLSFRAIAAGALELIAKPERREDLAAFGPRVIEAIRLMAEVPVISRRRPSLLPLTVPRQSRRVVEAVGVAASTGGPPVIAQILGSLAEGLQASVLIAQHMTPGFTEGFARWLTTVVGAQVEIARHGDPCQPGRIYLAPDGHHLEVDRSRRLVTLPAMGTVPCPSGNRLLRSMAAAYGMGSVGVVLTGMGDDGAAGLLEIRRVGGATMAQDAASCVVFGMPQAAAHAGATDLLLPPAGLASFLLELVRPR